jgi:hypothetical protein
MAKEAEGGRATKKLMVSKEVKKGTRKHFECLLAETTGQR